MASTDVQSSGWLVWLAHADVQLSGWLVWLAQMYSYQGALYG